MSIALIDSIDIDGNTFTTGQRVQHFWNDGTTHPLIIDAIFTLHGDTFVQYHYEEEYLKRMEISETNGETYSYDKVILPVKKFRQIFFISI